MRLHRATIILFAVFLSLVYTQSANAQLFDCVEGVDFDTYVPDTVKVNSFKGLPGDTVEMPLYFASDSAFNGAVFNVRYPANLITPLISRDTVVIDTFINTAVLPPDTTIDTTVTEFLTLRETGRAFFPVVLKDFQGFDSITVPLNLFRRLSVTIPDSNLIKVQLIPKIIGQGEKLDEVPGGSGVIVMVKFVVNQGLTLGQSGALTFENLPVLDTDSFPPIQRGCDLTTTAQDWTAFFFPDDTTVDTQIVPLVLIPTFGTGFFRVDVADTAECTDFTQCTTPPPGFKLPAFCVEGFCEYTLDTGVTPQECLTNSDCNSPPSGFTLPGTCDASNKCQYTVIVSGDAPVIEQQASPKLITQGETVSFTVTATDVQTDDVITFSGSFPPGATFQSTPSTSPAIGSFSWTPDLTQSGTFTVTFIATDDQGLQSSPMVVSIIVEELKFDQLFTTSAENQSPVGGIAGFDPVIFPINLTSRQDSVFGLQFDLRFPHLQASLDSIMTTPRTPFYTVDWIEIDDSTIRVVTLGLNNEAILPGLTTDVLRIIFSMDSTALPGVYPMTLFNGRESIDPDPTVGSVELLTLPGVIEVDNLGDVNLDKFIDVADMVSVVGYIIGNFTLPLRQFSTADVTANGVVNVVDLVGINNLIFGLPIIPGPTGLGAPLASLDLDTEDIKIGEYSQVSLIGDFPENVAGVEFRIKYDPSTISMLEPELTQVSSEFFLRYRSPQRGEMRVVLYKKASTRVDELIPEGISEILRLPMVSSADAEISDISISNIALSNQYAGEIATEYDGGEPVLPETFELSQNYPNPFNPSTTIEFAINADQGGAKIQVVSLDVFNILGQRVITLVDNESLTTGRYTVTWDGANYHGQKVATGVYLYRLKVGDLGTEARKMILLK